MAEKGKPPKQPYIFELSNGNACRIAAHRLRNSPYLSANTIPIREQLKDSVEFVRLVWEAIEQSLREEDHDEVSSERSAEGELDPE